MRRGNGAGRGAGIVSGNSFSLWGQKVQEMDSGWQRHSRVNVLNATDLHTWNWVKQQISCFIIYVYFSTILKILLRLQSSVEENLDRSAADLISGWHRTLVDDWWGLLCRLSDKESTHQCRRHRFDSWVGKIPWRKKWQPTPVFLPGESHGQRSLAGLQSMGPWSQTQLSG